MRTLTTGLFLAALLPSEAVAGAFTLDPVLVADMRALDGLSKARADELEAALIERMNKSFLLVSLDDVGDYESYTARAYVESCPASQLDGCAFVIGERADAMWVLIGSVEDNGDGHDVSVTFVDIEASRSLITVENRLQDGDDATWAGTMASVLNLIVEGAANEGDIRPDDEDAFEKSWQERRAQAERAAAELGEAGGLETMVRIPTRTEVKEPKVTKEEVAEYEETDATKPWERVGMSQGEFLRYRNSGMSLEAWKTRQLGRFGKVIARAGVGTGAGPYSMAYDGRWARDDQTLAVVHVTSFQEVYNGPSTFAELEVGFGVAPFLDVTGLIGFRTSTFEYYQHQETVGDPSPEQSPTPRSMSTSHVGARATVAPMPYSKVRPIASAAFTLWKGRQVTDFYALPTPLEADVYPAPTLMLLDIAPGIEVEAHEMVSVFGRLGATIPLPGTKYWESDVGSGLETLGTPRQKSGFGMAATVGVQFNYGLIKPKITVRDEFDEPEDDFDDEPSGDFDDIEILDID
ncbi:MAG: hypothetical protein EP330_22675 [Deltaproteobacteria bacterium]|nr:MAG: hypothetical protein EP330_22675 [Deltaproteobacteria bacterium]